MWADLISVFAYLNNFVLYEYTSGTGAAASMVPISLGDLLGALVIVGITFALAGNLPGLLEVLVLSRLNLAQGSAYATTTLLSYTIVGIGIVSTLSTLGVSWDKLQWLVAALSVGLGFGMQEIFANFISGIMILFRAPGTDWRHHHHRQPVRHGEQDPHPCHHHHRLRPQGHHRPQQDLHHRPAHQLVADRHGHPGNAEAGHRLRLGPGPGTRPAAQGRTRNPRVLKDPEPIVYFLNFGESSLDHELRMHVRDLGDRNPTLDEINRYINREFKAHNIKISVRQVEVFLMDQKGGKQQLIPLEQPKPDGTAQA